MRDPEQTKEDVQRQADPSAKAEAPRFPAIQAALKNARSYEEGVAAVAPVQAQGGGVQRTEFNLPKGSPLKDAPKLEGAFGVAPGSLSGLTVAENQGSTLKGMGAEAATQSGNISIQGSQSSDKHLYHEVGHAVENLKSRGDVAAAPAPMAGTNVCPPGSADEAAADSHANAAASKL